MRKFFFGIFFFFFGAISVLCELPLFAQLAYPFLWWGVLLVFEVLNERKWGSGMMQDARMFWGIVVPLSVLYWLYFELVNFAYPEWAYIGTGSLGHVARTILVVASFGTVIPAVLELFWFLNGPTHKSRDGKIYFSSRFAAVFVCAGIFSAIIPFVSDYFWLNQAVWFAPFFLLFPFVDMSALVLKFNVRAALGLGGKIIFAGFMSGILWESLNFWAGGKWVYLILPNAPHIFEMPLLGYGGFVPFALSTIFLYVWIVQHIRFRIAFAAAFSLLAIAASALFVAVA